MIMLHGKKISDSTYDYLVRNKLVTIIGRGKITVGQIINPQDMETKIERTEEWTKLNDSIESCTNHSQLTTLKEIVLKYYGDKKQDAPELIANYFLKDNELNPEK